ncbi:MAG: IS630 family transposase [Tepidisphaeraceae bacterium]
MVQEAGIAVQKKSVSAAEQLRPDVKERRDAWHEQLSGIDPRKLVFLDESGAKTDMARLRGRCDKGERLRTHSPAGHWKITTMISAVRLAGPFAAAVVSGATDSDVFRTYVNQVLTPQLSPGDVVVMDNLQPHHAAGVREAIEAAGAMLLYLPPYSPDFNPIENMGSEVK